jgi:hypothetical protein
MSVFRQKNIGHIEHWKDGDQNKGLTKPIFPYRRVLCCLLHAAVCIRGKQTGKKIGLKPILSLDE